jgi:hypothetical protein
MKSFVEELAEKLYTTYGEEIADICVVFPNHRTGLFFRNCLAKLIDKPVFAPDVFSIEGFVCEVSGLTRPDKLSLIFELYEIYRTLSNSYEPFDKFYFWGNMLVDDFSEADKYMVNTKLLFSNLKDYHELDVAFSELSEEQIEIIRSFWSAFYLSRQSEETSRFISLWTILYDLYQQYQARLKSVSHGYEGMIYREAAGIIQEKGLPLAYKKVVFAGFNALNACEELLITSLLKQHKAEVHWDVDQYYMENPVQEAGLFLRKYKKHPALGPTFPEDTPARFIDKEAKKITFVGVPLEVGQAKLMGQMLAQQPELNPQQTVIVTPEDTMLFPVLHSLPDAVEQVNVTMGYPLRNTPLYTLLMHLIDLQTGSKEREDGKALFNFKHVLAVLRHPYIFYHNPAKVQTNIRDIENTNRIYLQLQHLKQEDELYALIFRKVSRIDDVFDYLMDLLLTIVRYMKEEQPKGIVLEEEYVYQFFTHLKRLKEVLEARRIRVKLETFWRLFKQMADGLRLPFTGEPVQGLQVMGILESRNLDFENVFILSMNEGSFPPKHQVDTFIPHNLRKGFGMPVQEHYDAMYAYYFYRLLQRAGNIYLFYNTENSSNLSGEMSRFLYQLKYEGAYKIEERILSNKIRTTPPQPIEVKKTPEVQAALSKFLIGNKRNKTTRLTPTALNAYLDCQLRFYFRHVADLVESSEVMEEVDASVFGNLLHKAMELLYQALVERKKSSIVEAKDFEWLQTEVAKTISDAFKDHYNIDIADSKPFHYEGRNVVVRAIIEKLVTKVLELDKAYAPFEILGLEANAKEGYKVDLDVCINGVPEKVGLKGTIDRIDFKRGLVRVLDYKTGKDTARFESIHSLFDREDKNRNKAAMQTLFYGMLYLGKVQHSLNEVTVGLISTREIFNPNAGFQLKMRNEAINSYEIVGDINPLIPDFKVELTNLMEEIFDTEHSFTQTHDLKKCSICAYNGICHRS